MRKPEPKAGVADKKFVDEVYVTRPVFAEPRKGRKIVAQGVGPGLNGPHPAFGTPLPLGRERGWG